MTSKTEQTSQATLHSESGTVSKMPEVTKVPPRSPQNITIPVSIPKGAKAGDFVNIAGSKEKARLIEITPGKLVADVPRTALPRYGIVEFRQQTDGSLRPHFVVHGQYRPSNAVFLESIGFEISESSFYRLIRGGFVEAVMLTPKKYHIDLESFFDHVESVRDPEFWDEENCERFRTASFGKKGDDHE
ncbi:MAG: hypothetical protein AAGA96_09740 [Verrucomicrobiota bacterium]